MAWAARRWNCPVGDGVRWVAVFLSAALVTATTAPPMPAAAQMLRCAGHSLSRQDIISAETAARPALPSSVHLVATGACWNHNSALVWFETSKVLTPEGVKQWWAERCQRDQSTWKCDAPEFKQAILVTLPFSDETRRVELSFDKLISLKRARALAARALAIYGDPTSRLPTCSNEGIENPPSDPHGIAGSVLRADPIVVPVSRTETRDSVTLEGVSRDFEFPALEDPAMPHAACWLAVIVVT